MIFLIIFVFLKGDFDTKVYLCDLETLCKNTNKYYIIKHIDKKIIVIPLTTVLAMLVVLSCVACRSLLIGVQLHSRHFYHCRVIDEGGVFCVEEDAVVHRDIVDHLLRPLGRDGCFGVAAGDAADVDVAELRDEVLCLRFRGGRTAHGSVGIGCLEGDGFVLDVAHIDVADVDAAGFASSSRSTLETKAGVGA